MEIGFLGIGPMGAPMARNLLRAGHRVTVWNRSRARAEALAGDGAVVAATPAEAAAHPLVFTSLANDEAVAAVVLGENGLAEGLPQGGMHISTSTISIALSERLTKAHAERGQVFLSATVLGRPPAAEAGKLFVMAAGPAAAIEIAQPLLERLGQRVFVVGDTPRQANLIKLSTNFLIFSTIEQLSEVFALNEKGGIDRAKVFEVLTESFFGAPVHRNYGKLILERAFDPPGATVVLGAKDTKLALEAGEQLAVPMPFASVVRDRFVAAVARGEKDLDFTVISRQAAENAGLPTK